MPLRDLDYPGSYAELRAWFSDDRACLDYLDWLRWGRGFTCPHCGDLRSWPLPDGRRSCGGCSRRISATAATIFHRTRTPLTVWFAAAWHFTSQKNGVSALYLQRVLGLGSYQTAWTMLHRFRSATVRPGRDRLSGEAEVDETMIGGRHPGPPGRGAVGKTLAAIAVERHPGVRRPTALGRCRLAVIPNAGSAAWRAFLVANVEPGSTVVTDGWSPYRAATAGLYTHAPINLSVPGTIAHVALPGVHRIATLVKRWLLGTHHGAVEQDHLAGYLDEFAFRFNRRSSRARGLLFYRLLELAVAAPPRPYVSLLANPGQKKRMTPTAPISRAVPRSLVAASLLHPWRQPSPGATLPVP